MALPIWDHKGEESKMAEAALTKEFPECREVIQDATACTRALHSQNIHTKELEDRLCREKKSKVFIHPAFTIYTRKN